MSTAKNILKGWFVTRAKPIQAHFHAWLDSFWHKDDPIPANKVVVGNQDLVTYLNDLFFFGTPLITQFDGDDGAVTVGPRRTVYALLLFANDDMTLKLGSTPNGDEVATVDLIGGEYKWVELAYVNQNDDQEILLFFSDVTAILKVATYFRNNPFS